VCRKSKPTASEATVTGVSGFVRIQIPPGKIFVLRDYHAGGVVLGRKVAANPSSEHCQAVGNCELPAGSGFPHL
jgi:hypothetical protein